MTAAATPADVLAGRATWCVVEGDNSAARHDLADGSIDVSLADPPYSERVHKGYKTSRWKKGETQRHVAIGFSSINPTDVAPELLRITRGWVIAFCSMEQLGAYADAAGKGWIRSGIWHRPRASPQFNGSGPAQAVEGIAIMHARRTKQRWNGGGSHAFWSVGHQPEEEGADRGHPTRKPLLLMRELVRLFSDKGEVIADLYAGSGTTGVAAIAEGRRAILYERDPAFAAVAIARCTAAENGVDWRANPAQIPLFGGMK